MRAWFVVVSVAAGLALFGCSGGGAHVAAPGIPAAPRTPGPSGAPAATPTGSGAVVGGPALTYAQRQVVFTGIEQLYTTLPHASAASDAASVEAYLRQSPILAAVGGQGPDVWATFTDGVPYEVILDRPPSAVPGPSQTLTIGSVNRVVSSARRGVRDFLTGPVLLMIDTYDFSSANAQLVSSAFGQMGYSAAWGDLTVDLLRALPTASIDYVDSHGAVDYLPAPGTSPVPNATPNSYGIKTSTLVQATDTQDATLQADLAADRLVIAQSLRDTPTGGAVMGDPTYAINDRFAAEYFKNILTPNGLFFDNACEGMMAGSEPFQNAVLGAAQAGGTATYMGWSNSVVDTDAQESMRFLFDRLLGESAQALLTQALAQAPPHPESPYQRPFSLPEVDAAMQQRNRDDGLPGTEAQSTYQGAVAQLEGVSSGGVAGVLAPLLGAPSIQDFGNVDEVHGTMEMSGEFGATPGSVIVSPNADGSNGTPLQVSSWTPSSITVTLPATGAGAYGYIFVRSPNGAESNTVPLTEWDLTLEERDSANLADSAGGSGSTTASATYTVHVRADVQPYRSAPAPLSTPAMPLFGMNERADSTASASVSASFSDPNSSISFKGNGAVPADSSSSGNGQASFGFSAGVPLQGGCGSLSIGPGPATGMQELCATLGLSSGPLTTCSNGPTGSLCENFPYVGLNDVVAMSSNWIFNLDMDGSYALDGNSAGVNGTGNQIPSGNNLFMSYQQVSGARSALTWQTATANAPPTAQGAE